MPGKIMEQLAPWLPASCCGRNGQQRCGYAILLVVPRWLWEMAQARYFPVWQAAVCATREVLADGVPGKPASEPRTV